MLRDSSQEKQLVQLVNDDLRRNMSGHQHGQALPGVFIDDHEYPEGSTISGTSHYEVVTPDMVLVFGAKPYA